MIDYLFNELPKKDQKFIESFVDMDIMKIIKYAKKQEIKMAISEVKGDYNKAEAIERKVDILNAIIDARAKLN